MMKRPRFRRQFHVVPVEAGPVFLFHEGGHVLLDDRLSAMLAPWLDGRHDLPAIAQRLQGRANILDVQYGLSVLEERGYIEDAHNPASIPATFGAALSVSAGTVESRLQAVPVSVTVLGSIDAAAFQTTLESIGVRVADDANHRVVLVDDYLHPALLELNRRAIRRNERWLLAKPVGAVLWMGPALQPPRTPCWACLALRLERNRPAHVLAASLSGRPRDSMPAVLSGLPPATTQAGIALAAIETFKWIVQERRPLPRARLATLDLRQMRLDWHVVVRQPLCRDCGQTAPSVVAPPALEPGQTPATGISYRTPPEAIIRRFRHHISPITGLLDRPRVRYRKSCPHVHIYEASHAFTPPSGDRPGSDGLRARSCGTGFTADEARAAAICEALERYSGVFQGNEPRVTATCAELGASAVPPDMCLHFSRRQFARREERNRQASRYNWIPEPFEETVPIEWTPVRCLTSGGVRYVPTAYGYYGYPRSPGRDFCRADSNGVAAGALVEEAVLHGFFELVERDSVALWWYNRVRRPGIALDTFAHPAFSAIETHHRQLRRSLHLLDITTDLGIPAVAAVSIRHDPGGADIVVGFAAHLDVELAVGRALKELSQMLAWVMEERGRRVLTDQRLDLSYLVPDPTIPPRRKGDFPAPDLDLPRAVATCVSRAEACGLRTLVLDQTRPDVGLPVVKVIVPGLRSWWPRFAPGRLYEVPERLGWLPCRLSEDELNPVEIYF